MSESLWLDTGDYIKDYLWSKLGPDGDYDTLVLADAFCTVLREITDMESRPKPSLVVSGKDLVRDNGGHGDGDIHYDRKMPFIVAISTAVGTQEESVREARILEARLEKALIDLRISISSGNGEYLNYVEVGNSRITKYKPRPDLRKGNPRIDTDDEWYAVSATSILAESTI